MGAQHSKTNNIQRKIFKNNVRIYGNQRYSIKKITTLHQKITITMYGNHKIIDASRPPITMIKTASGVMYVNIVEIAIIIIIIIIISRR